MYILKAYRTKECCRVRFKGTMTKCPTQKQTRSQNKKRTKEKHYCDLILIPGAINNVEFAGKTIHEFKYQQYKIPSVRLRILNLLVNHGNIWY